MLQMALYKFSLEKHPSDMTMVDSLTVNNEGARYYTLIEHTNTTRTMAGLRSQAMNRCLVPLLHWSHQQHMENIVIV